MSITFKRLSNIFTIFNARNTDERKNLDPPVQKDFPRFWVAKTLYSSEPFLSFSLSESAPQITSSILFDPASEHV